MLVLVLVLLMLMRVRGVGVVVGCASGVDRYDGGVEFLASQFGSAELVRVESQWTGHDGS